MRIGLDVMGGDYAPDAPILGAILAQQSLPQDTRIVLIGDEQKINELLVKHGADKNNFDVVHASEVIGMGEHPTKAFTQKPNSSIALGFGLLASQKIDAFASNGNTGAMLVGAMFAIKVIPGVIRPCITTILPKEDGSVGVLLDVGINADCKADVLCQFGLLGSLLAEFVYGIKKPKVGLLNIGEEPEKGNLLAQAAHALMKENKDFNFVGNIEGRDLFDNKADVVVCDGFTGNVVLKLAESTYTTLKRRGLSDEYFERYNYENYGGTPLLGVNSTVMIGHGISNEIAVKNMLMLTKDVVDAKLSEKIQKALNNE